MSRPATRPLIIDTDPGQDDAIALLAALASPDELDLLGITCVAGNVPLALTARNARLVCELAGRPDVAVYAGCSRPMVRPLVTAEYVHGSSGLDGYDWGEPTTALQEQHGVDWLIATLLGAPAEGITVCTVGPVTNLAMAMVKEPRVLPNIREVLAMGGAYWEGGNRTPVAEFNIYVDPHAAATVVASGVPLTVFSLDVTHKALMPQRWIDDLAALGTPVGTAAAGMLGFFERYDEAKYGTAGGPLHDPHTVAYLLAPELYQVKEVHLAIETASELTVGQTVVDWWGVTGREPNCRWVHQVDADGYFGLLFDRLARFDR
jgi:purine nucleosidase